MVLPGKPESYIEVSVAVPNNLCDAVCNFIIENICAGLVLEEEEGSDETCVKFYLLESRRNDFDQKLTTYFSSLISMGESLARVPRIEEKRVRSVEWEEQYRRSVEPILVAKDVAVRPPWKTAPAKARFDIVIEPKMAFGTGTHESTRGCIEAIRGLFKPGMRFLDLGCGSGILSILADRMGAAYIKAVDNDLLAVENCGENFLVNSVSADHEIVHGSIERCQGDKPYDFVCANIIKSTILDLLDDIKCLTAPKGLIVLAGLLDQDVEEISQKLAEIDLADFEIFDDNEWRVFTVRTK